MLCQKLRKKAAKSGKKHSHGFVRCVSGTQKADGRGGLVKPRMRRIRCAKGNERFQILVGWWGGLIPRADARRRRLVQLIAEQHAGSGWC